LIDRVRQLLESEPVERDGHHEQTSIDHRP
jgi:hypothetical protein